MVGRQQEREVVEEENSRNLETIQGFEVKKEVINATIKQSVMTRLWLETLDSSKVFKHWQPEKTRYRPYFLRSKLELKLLFALRIDELNFKMSRRRESIKKYGGVHVAECFGYKSRIKPGYTEKELADYLWDLHAERIRKFGQPLV